MVIYGICERLLYKRQVGNKILATHFFKFGYEICEKIFALMLT